MKEKELKFCDLYSSHSWYVPGMKGMFALFGFILLGMVLGGILVIFLKSILPMEIIDKYDKLVLTPLTYLPAIIYVSRKSRRNSQSEIGYKLNSSHFGPFKGWQIALITVALVFATMITAEWPNYWNDRFFASIPSMQSFHEMISEILKEGMVDLPFWVSVICTAIFPAIFEEWLCRGIVLRGLLTRMKPVWAIVISALFFGVIHLNPWQMLNAFILGMLMGYIYYKTGSLWLTMLYHFVNNGSLVILAQIPAMEEVEYFKDLMPLSIYVVVYALCIVVMVASLMAFQRIPQEQERGNIDRR